MNLCGRLVFITDLIECQKCDKFIMYIKIK